MTSRSVLLLAHLLWLLAAAPSAATPPSGTAPSPTTAAAAPAPVGADRATAPTEAQEADRKRIRALIDAKELSEAEAAARAVIADLERRHGPDSLPAARILDLLAETVRRRRAEAWFDEATRLANRALDIKTKALGPASPELAVSLKELGAICQTDNDLDGAAAHYERAIGILEPVAAADDPDLATLFANLGLLRLGEGRYQDAGTLLERALAMRERHFGYVSAPVARVLDNLINLELERSNFEQALIYAKRNLTICEQLFPEGHPNLAAPLENEARVLYEMGDDRSAKPLYERAIAIREQSEGAEGYLANDLNSLGTVLDRLGAFDAAQERYTRARDLYVALEDEAGLAGVLNNMTDLEVRRGRLDAAAALFEESLRLTERLAGPDDPQVASILQGYGRVEVHRGHPDVAAGYFKRALDIDRAALGDDHPGTAQALLSHAWFLATRGDLPGAVSGALRAETVGRDTAVAAFGAVSERAALRFAEKRVSGTDLAQSIVVRGADQATRSKVWSAVIRSRGLVLDEMSARARLEAAPAGPRAEQARRRLQAARAEHARLLVGGIDTARGETAAQYGERLEKARREREQAEQDFALRSASFSRQRADAGVGLAQIGAALPPGSALVAFSRFRHDDLSGKAPPAAGLEAAYAAYVLPAAGAVPAVVDLGAASKIEALVEAWLAEVSQGPAKAGRTPGEAEAAYRAAGTRLGDAVWAPIAKHVARARQVLIVPDGAFHLVNFAALPVGDAGYLVETGPLIHHLTTERQMVAWPDSAAAGPKKATGLLAFGGIDFDAAVVGGAAAAPAVSVPGRLPCSGFEQIRFSALPGTVDESRAIGAIWEKAGRGRPEILSGDAGSEAALKARAGGQRVLHLATHGFFLRAGCVTPDAAPGASSRGVGTTTAAAPPVAAAAATVSDLEAGENPLLFSGLALAGANNRLRAGPHGEDGILLAEEIAGLDLSGVEWAVLSACDTGVGEIAASEGVLGLRRAFQQAGVRTVITSLWSVKDQPTRQWMEALYDARFAAGKGTAEAVREADRALLARREAQGASTHPHYWAGFIAVGDWR